MDFTGTFSDLMVDFSTGKQKAVLTLNEDARQTFENFKDKELSISIKKYRKKRSLDANSYFHVLVGKIADVIGNSKPAVKNILLAKYGQYATDENGIIHMIIRDDYDVSEREDIHLSPTSNVKVLDDGKLYRVYRLMRGSHEYDTSEMAKLIDGTVSDAKELGIETMTPTQLKEMKERWKINV